jgi:hypothetical protein|eukprot:COSAG03_NODE_15_length_22165_cov_72.809934_17_plen_76_part_00
MCILHIYWTEQVALERAAQSFEHGKFGVMQRMHTHKNGYYDKLNEAHTGQPEYTDYYGIVPLWDMSALRCVLVGR